MSDRHNLTPAGLYARVSSDRQDVDLSVAAVPDGDQAVLGPQLVASNLPARRRRPVAAGPW